MKYTDKVRGLKETARALEDSFFAKENDRILKELRAASVREGKKKEFREYLNIENEELLDALVNLAVDIAYAWLDPRIRYDN